MSFYSLNYDDQVSDGFYEVFGEFPEAVTSKDDFPVLPALHCVLPKPGARREVILFDTHTDPVLISIIEEARAALTAVSCTPDVQSLGCHRQLSLVVAGRLGGPQPKIQDLASPSLKHIDTLQSRSRTVVIPIGQIFIGSVRHRAILYKYLADIFGLKCRVMKGRFYANNDDDARVVVDVNNGEEYEIDLMTRPGTSAPLEKRLALRASSREVAGTDVFSRASSVGGSTAGTANTAPASRSQSDAAGVDSIQAITAASEAAIAAVVAAQAAAAAAGGGAQPQSPSAGAAVPEPIPTPDAPLEAGLTAATTLEQAMQMAAAAAMGQDFTGSKAGGSGTSGGNSGSLPSPFENSPSMEPPASAPQILFDANDLYGGSGRYSSQRISSNPSPYDNPSVQGWPGQPAGFGSPMPSEVLRNSAPYMYNPGDPSEPIRRSLGPNVGAAGGDVQVEEMGPAALISDASGQQYILQPVRASMDYSYMRPPIDPQSSLTNRMSSDAPGMATAQRGGTAGSSGDLYSSGSIPSLQHSNAAEMLRQASLANRGLPALAENSTLDRTSADIAAQPHRYSQPVPHQHQYQPQQQYYHPPRTSLPDPGVLSSSLNSNGGGYLASRPGPLLPQHDADALQWAAIQAAGSGKPTYTDPGALHDHPLHHQPYNNNSATNLDAVAYHNNSTTDSTDVVSRLYLDSIRTNSVRMSVPIEFEARQALLTRPFPGSGLAGDAGTAAGPSDADPRRQQRASFDSRGTKLTRRSSADGIPFPQAELPGGAGREPSEQSMKMYTPFGAIDGTLNGSGSDTVSPKSSTGALSPETSLKHKAAIAAHAAAVLASTRAPSTAHNALPDLRDYKQARALSPSTISSLMSGGDGYLASVDSRDLVDDGWEIDADELQLGNRIGIGSYGEVYRGQWRQTDVAIKVFLDQELGARMLESFKKEVSIMKKLRHPNIVQFMGACSKPPNLCIVTQYVARGSLFKLLHRSEGNPINMDERRRLQMALDVARGMNYLHTCRPPVIHRDLKSPNLLVEKDMTIKVCDFGLSRVRHATVLSAKSQAGTPEWTAPEVLQGKPCNESSDVYSFGVILWELQTGEEPWTDKSAMQVVGAVGFANERLPVPEGTKPAMADLMSRCFGTAEDRPSFSEIISLLKRQIVALVTAGSAKSAAATASASDKSSGDMVA